MRVCSEREAAAAAAPSRLSAQASCTVEVAASLLNVSPVVNALSQVQLQDKRLEKIIEVCGLLLQIGQVQTMKVGRLIPGCVSWFKQSDQKYTTFLQGLVIIACR